MIAFETILVWTALFRELWVAIRTFTRQGHAPLSSLLALSFWVNAYQARYAEPSGWPRLLGFALLIASLTLLEWAAFSIRGKMFSYLGSQDTPHFVFTGGPYAYIRHPFYSCYLHTHIAIALIFPTRWTIAVLAFTFILLRYATEFEENKFARSPHAEAYKAYMARTGRFWPRFRR